MHPSKLMLSNTTETMHSDIYRKKIVENNLFFGNTKEMAILSRPGTTRYHTTLLYRTPGTVPQHTTPVTTLNDLPPSISPFSAIATSFFFLPLGFPLILVHPATP
jgi:hypothetical protein